MDTIQAPKQLKPTPDTGRPTAYNQDTAQAILDTIATTDKNVETIAEEHGITARTFCRWLLINEEFCHAYRRAMGNKALILGESITNDIENLKKTVDRDDIDTKWQTNQLGYFDKKWRHLEWFMGKYNREMFGDKLDMTAEVSLQPAQAREEAWKLASRREAEYTEVEDVDSTSQDVNQSKDTPGTPS